MKRWAVAIGAIALAACFALSAGAASVVLESKPVTTKIGEHFTFVTTVENQGSSPAADLVAHLNVLSNDPGTYVDPEDWSPHRTQYLPTIGPNGKLRLTWTVQAVNSGSFSVYVGVLPRHGAGAVVTSAPLRVMVAERRTLNSRGVLPLTLGIPAAIGLLGLGTRRRRRS
jgi:hypothetical protein